MVWPLALLACVVSAAPAIAEPKGDPAVAEALFREGLRLMDDQDFAGARRKLDESQRLDPDIATLVKLAECEERLGELTSAHLHLDRAVKLARARGSKLLQPTEERYRRLGAIVPKVVLRMPSGVPEGLTIQRDDVALGAGALDTPLPVNPGKHAFVAGAPGHKDVRVDVEVKADGASTVVTIPALERLPQEAPPLPATETTTVAMTGPFPMPQPPKREEPSPSSGRARIWISGGLLGAGVVGLGVGTYFGIRASSEFGKAGCKGSACPTPDAVTTFKSAQGMGTTATWAFVVGGVLSAGGVVYYFVAPRDRGPRLEVSVGEARLVGSF